MREMLKLVGPLLIITLVAGLALGVTNALTRDAIERQNQSKQEQARQAVFPGAEFESAEARLADIRAQDERFSAVSGAYYAIVDGQRRGCVILLQGKGYGGSLELTVGVTADGTVAGVVLGSHSETPGLGANATGEDFLGQFAGKQAPLTVVKGKATADDQIEALTSATITSRGVTDAVNLAAKFGAALLEGEDGQ